MANLIGTEIGEYKSLIFRELLFTQKDDLSKEIVQAIDPDYLGYEDEMLYKYVYPYLRVPPTQMETGAYIMMAVNVPRVSTVNYFFKEIIITIVVLVHQESMRMHGTNRTRADYIGERINRIFNGNTAFTGEKLEYVSDVEDVLNEKYHTRTIRFKSNEMNSEDCDIDRLNTF